MRRSVGLVVSFLVLGSAVSIPAQSSVRAGESGDRFAVRDPENNPATPEKIALGHEVFESTMLSRTRTISCATCHDPAASFADGVAQSKGIFGVEVGRNSPTLVVAGHMPGFKGPPRKRERSAGGPVPTVLDLEARCLAPIDNPIEMGTTLDDALAALGAVPGMKAKFDEAFGYAGPGVTAERLGRALAAYLRSLRPPESPYRAFLEGDLSALDDAEFRGLGIFRSRGKCASCHAGPALTDGLFHAVLPGGSFRSARQRERAGEAVSQLIAVAAAPLQAGKAARSSIDPRPMPVREQIRKLARDLAQAAGGGPAPGGYNPVPQGGTTQTPTLWDVARTGPYFRDGLVPELETAVRQHVAELRDSARSAMAGCPPPPGGGTTPLPQALLPRRSPDEAGPIPPALNEAELADLMAFLRALSPRGAGCRQ